MTMGYIKKFRLGGRFDHFLDSANRKMFHSQGKSIANEKLEEPYLF